MDQTSIYQGALMEHNAYPDYKYEMDNPTSSHHGINPSCGDDIVVSIQVEDGIVTEAAFVGNGCAVSQASADIMCDQITGKTVAEAKEIVQSFTDMIHGEELSEEACAALGEATELEPISRMPARVKCAVLAWKTLDHLLSEEEKSHEA